MSDFQPKYEFTGETNPDGLRRIRRIRDGVLGGFLGSEANLSHHGECWVSGESCVYGNANVRGDAIVCDEAHVFGNANVGMNAIVQDEATVCEWGQVFGRARIRDNAEISGYATVRDECVISGYAEVGGDVSINGSVEICNRAQVRGNVMLRGGVLIGGNALVMCSGCIEGDVFIDDNVSVSGHAKLRTGRFHGDAVIDRPPPQVIRTDGYVFSLVMGQDGVWKVSAGCRFFTFPEAWEHWEATRSGTALGEETFAILVYLGSMTRLFDEGVPKRPAAAAVKKPWWRWFGAKVTDKV